jgi:hypothetical protein
MTLAVPSWAFCAARLISAAADEDNLQSSVAY